MRKILVKSLLVFFSFLLLSACVNLPRERHHKDDYMMPASQDTSSHKMHKVKAPKQHKAKKVKQPKAKKVKKVKPTKSMDVKSDKPKDVK